jgi:hypothetical protein
MERVLGGATLAALGASEAGCAKREHAIQTDGRDRCTCHTVCTCDTVTNGLSKRYGSTLAGGACTCNTVCTCDTVDRYGNHLDQHGLDPRGSTGGSGGGGGGGYGGGSSYYYPN